MKEIASSVRDRQEELGPLKLMVLYRSTEKMLANTIGDTEGITVIYYHHSVSYKYRGRLRAQNILASVYPYMSLLPEEVPLKMLNTPDDLNTFLQSTDRALLLLEFCGWTPRLLSSGKKNGTETNFSMLGEVFGKGSDGNTNIKETRGKTDRNQKDTENAKMICEAESGFSTVPWIGEYHSFNISELKDTEVNRPGVGSTCTFEALQRFDSFFSKFMAIAKEFFLPTERHSFGLISERSLLSSLGVIDSGSWLAMQYFAGCPNCSRIITEEDDLNNVMQLRSSVVRELEDEGYAQYPILPANTPTVVLFVDRTSRISETRRKSVESLNAFRELALHHQMSYQKSGENNDKPVKSSVQADQASSSTPGHPKLKLSFAAQRRKSTDKMSIMIINEEKNAPLNNIASDLQGSSLHEILAHLLQQKKEQKLSSLAKEVGFQLLSDDFDIKAANTLISRGEDHSTQFSRELSEEGVDGIVTSLPREEDQLRPDAIIYSVDNEKKPKATNLEPSSMDVEEQMTVATIHEQTASVEQENVSLNNEVLSEDVTREEKYYLVDQNGQQELQLEGLAGCFLFSDGNYRFLKSLTGVSKTPSLVIIDPISQQHYVFPEDTIMNYNSMANFLTGFLNGRLLPYQRSEHVPASPRETTHPPFVNLDFHEMNSIPRVTSHSFIELAIGFNDSDIENGVNAWNKDVMVLFSNDWCGFCQRMELVVREVYRAMKGYMNILKNGSRNGETGSNDDNFKNTKLKVPLIYLMDCTLNDCSLILRSLNQRDAFPALILFPAERKTALSYEGDITVADVIKFIANHGSYSHHLISAKGFLRHVKNEGDRISNLVTDASGTAIRQSDKFHEVLLKNRNPQREINYDQMESHTSKGSESAGSPSVVAGSILVATDKLLSPPFDKSMVLVVKADQNYGFQGLIINKHVRWDTLHELEGLELLKHAPLSFGGPLMTRGLPLVALSRRFIKDKYPEVLPGVYFLDQSATIFEIEELKSGNQSTADYWFFLGYSSWGWDQLFGELAEGAWKLSEDNGGNLAWPEV